MLFVVDLLKQNARKAVRTHTTAAGQHRTDFVRITQFRSRIASLGRRSCRKS